MVMAPCPHHNNHQGWLRNQTGAFQHLHMPTDTCVTYLYNYDQGIWWKAEPVYQSAMRPKTLNLTALTAVCQVVRMFSSCIFKVR